MELTGKQKRHLRALGHGLRPMVQVGKNGIQPMVVTQASACLEAHELIKVKLLETCPMERDDCAVTLAQATQSTVAQTLGRTFLLYRPHPETPVIELPRKRTSAGPEDA